MGTKQVKVDFLIVADNGVSADVTIIVNGQSMFSGALANTNSSIPGPNTPDNPYSTAQFDLTLENADPNVTPDTVPMNIEMLVSGGSAIYKSLKANYTIGSTPAEFIAVFPSAQPTWNGQPLKDRFDIDSGANGPMLINPDELLAFPVNMYKYSSSL